MRTYTPLPDDDYTGNPGCLVILILAAATLLLSASLIGFIHLVTLIF